MLDSPLATYHILIGASALLLIMGLIMVFSASSVESYKLFGSSFVLAERQFMFAGIGVLLTLGVSRLPISTVRKSAWPLLILAVLLLMAVLVIGVSVA
jgi:cell division protein FtsW